MSQANLFEYQLTIRTTDNGNPILVLAHKENSWWSPEKIKNAIIRSPLTPKQKRRLLNEGISLIGKKYSEPYKTEAQNHLQDGLNTLEINKVNSNQVSATFADLIKEKGLNFSFAQ